MFDSEQKETPSTQTQENNAGSQTLSHQSQFDTMLSGIKNEQGEQKYRSVEDGLNALKHSQEYIAALKKEMAEKDKALAEAKAKEDKITILEQTLAQLTQRQQEANTQAAPLDEEQLANLVDKRLTLKQQAELEALNQQKVVQALKAKFGEKAREVFYEKASELGLPAEELEKLSARSPQAVFTMLGISGETTPKSVHNSPAQSKVNTEYFLGTSDSFIGAETERIPLGGGEQHYNRILENATNMVKELRENGMSIDDLTNPANYMKYMRNKGK